MREIRNNKKAQDEMVGFALIVIIVAIVFIVFISIYIKKPTEKTVDYEANSFVQALLQYTTTCEEDNLENLTVQKLIFKCHDRDPCDYRNMDPCVILNDTIKNVARASWDVGPQNSVKGYTLTINITEGSEEVPFLNITGGVVTNNYRGAIQDFGKGWDHIVILFNAYG